MASRTEKYNRDFRKNSAGADLAIS
jgi:hypothetical protein